MDRCTRERRHPLCPECGYDLVATRAGGGKICPECGESFDTLDLNWERLPGDWSITSAARSAARTLAVRGMLCLSFCSVLTLVSILANNVDLPGTIGFALALFQAWILGDTLSRNLSDQAGFYSTMLAVAAAVIALLCGAASSVLSQAILTPTYPAMLYMHVILSVFAAWMWIFYQLLLENL